MMPEECWKVPYPTRRAAQQWLKNIHKNRAKRRDNQQIERRIYKCPVCDQWHFTSMPTKEYKRRKA